MMYKYYKALKTGALKLMENVKGPDGKFHDGGDSHQISFENGKPVMMREKLQRMEGKLLEKLEVHPEVELLEVHPSEKDGLDKVIVRSGPRMGQEYYEEHQELKDSKKKYVVYVEGDSSSSIIALEPVLKGNRKTISGFSTKNKEHMAPLFDEAKAHLGIKEPEPEKEEEPEEPEEKPKEKPQKKRGPKKGSKKGKRGKK